jgi:signal transduction histidine kinase
VYVWTGGVGIAAIAILGLATGMYLRRQMRLTRLKNDLTATVSHELKTPLSSMRVLVDTLVEGRCKTPQQEKEYLGLIARENQRLSRLIDNFLTFSRMERNKRAFEFRAMEITEVVLAAVEALGERAHAVQVQMAQGLPAIRGDRDALVTVVVNLLDNARKYSPDSKEIDVQVFPHDNDVCIAVKDQGVGIARRHQRKIFQRFYQVDRSLSRPAGGCGLGLSIVRFIVEAHGGRVTVASQLGKGSTFTVRLPGAHSPDVEVDHGR